MARETSASASESSKLNERTGGESQPPYSYFESSTISGTSFVNNDSSLWILVLGFDTTAIFAANGANIFLGTFGQNANPVDLIELRNTNAAGTTIFAFGKKFLIPPKGSFQTNSAASIGFLAIKGKFDDIIKLI